MTKLKIAIVSDDSLDRPDGVQQHIMILSEWLIRSGHQLRFLVGETKKKSINGHKIHSLSKNISIKANQNRLTLPLPVRNRLIRQIFEKERFDLIHVMLPYSPFLGRVVIKEALNRQIKIIGTFHTFPQPGIQLLGSKIYGLLIRKQLTRFNEIISVSEPTAKYVKSCFRVDSEVIPNFIRLDQFSKTKLKQSLRPAEHNMVYMGRLVERKGPQHLIEALRIIKEQQLLEDWHVYICGKGPMQSKLEERVKNLELSKHVTFTGFIKETEKPHYLASSDLAIYPATGGEAFGIVLLEAMASGTVVLGGDNPGYRSVIGDKAEHLLVVPHDDKQFAQKIVKLLINKEIKNELLKWQGLRVKEFGVDRVAQDLEKIYLRSLGKR